MKLSDLDTLIPQYAANKAEMDSYKKICDRENAEIKSIMKDFALQHHEAGGYKATYSVTKRESMNEDQLLSMFTSIPGFVTIANNYGVVKTREYIDFDALEKALYDGALSDAQIADLDTAREVKEVVTLRISKVKEKKVNE